MITTIYILISAEVSELTGPVGSVFAGNPRSPSLSLGAYMFQADIFVAANFMIELYGLKLYHIAQFQLLSQVQGWEFGLLHA
jgi:hypothetical protein